MIVDTEWRVRIGEVIDSYVDVGHAASTLSGSMSLYRLVGYEGGELVGNDG